MPFACTPLQLQQIYEGPCPPCSAHCRHWWPPHHRSAAVRRGWWQPAQSLQKKRNPFIQPSTLWCNIKNFLNRFNDCHFFTFSHHNLKTAWLVTHHSTCRCGSTPGSELWDYEGPQVHAGSWERWGHFLPPGCPGYVGKEVACLLHPLHTPEASQTYIRNNQCIRFSEAFYILKTMFCPYMFLNWQHFSVCLCASVSNNVLSHLPVWDEAPSLLLCNLWWSPRPSIPPQDLGSKPEWTETQMIWKYFIKTLKCYTNQFKLKKQLLIDAVNNGAQNGNT